MRVINKIPKWIKSKYLIAGISFIIWMLFFDRNDIPLQISRINELKTLEKSENKMDILISETNNELTLLKKNPATLEKYAREKYMMKKDNEDLYIITSTNGKKTN